VSAINPPPGPITVAQSMQEPHPKTTRLSHPLAEESDPELAVIFSPGHAAICSRWRDY